MAESMLTLRLWVGLQSGLQPATSNRRLADLISLFGESQQRSRL
jgi:hypothetical protein